MQSMERQKGENALREEPEIKLAIADARIAWVLDHPHMSDSLKRALRTADGLNPMAMQNDIEMLRHLITPWVQAQIEIRMSPLQLL